MRLHKGAAQVLHRESVCWQKPQSRSQDVANVLWALGHLQHHPGDEAVKQLLHAMVVQVRWLLSSSGPAEQDLNEWIDAGEPVIPGHYSMVLYGLTALSHDPGQRFLKATAACIQAQPERLDARARLLSSFDPALRWS